ncbi:MAG: putative glycoside hydrolase [Lachnospiraceae bacterium]|nr:putative glycoside hydrolase [Lachnospiraceae bacterium]
MLNVKYKKIVSIVLLISIVMMLLSCGKKEVIDYDINLHEVEESIMPTKEFSFDRPMDQGYQSKVVTKKDRDRLTNNEIIDLIQKRTKQPTIVHGIYLPAYVVGNEKKFGPIFENICNSNINAIIVDVKDELGRITIDIDGEIIKDLKTKEVQIKDVDAFLQRCHDNNIYVVARVASFLDNFAPRQDKTMAVRKKDGAYYKDNSGYFWLNPFEKKVQDYIKEIGIACAKKGFDEVQYDYFRFSADRGMNKVVFPQVDEGKTKMDILTEIAENHYQSYIKENVYFSLDVFGAIINSYKDQYSIGQDYNSLVKYCDYICPMVYPSHYANKTFGIDVPDLEPYRSVYEAMQSSIKSIQSQYDKTAHYGQVRPWLQAFTANYIPEYMVYDPEQYKEQIKAVKDSGYEEWIFWQGGGVYKWGAFLKDGAIDATKVQ